MADEIFYDLGVDLNNTNSFVNGDLALSSYNDNLVQAVVNRLNTELDELDLFYEGYGSILSQFFGWRANDTTLAFIRAEVSKVLSEEVRMVKHECTVTYDGDGRVRIDLVLYPTPDYGINANLVLRETGVITLETDEIEIGGEA